MMMMLHARASSCWTCTSEPSREVCGCVRLCILSSVCAAFVYRLCSCVENAHRDRNRRVADGAQPRRGLARQQLRAPARLAQAAVATRHQHHLLRCGHVQEADAALLHPRRRRRPQWRQRCSLRWKRRRRRRRKWRGRGLHRCVSSTACICLGLRRRVRSGSGLAPARGACTLCTPAGGFGGGALAAAHSCSRRRSIVQSQRGQRDGCSCTGTLWLRRKCRIALSSCSALSSRRIAVAAAPLLFGPFARCSCAAAPSRAPPPPLQ